MAFEGLSDKLGAAFKKLKNKGKLRWMERFTEEIGLLCLYLKKLLNFQSMTRCFSEFII